MTVKAGKRKPQRERVIHPKARIRLWSHNWTLWTLLLAILFFAGVRYRLRDAPLERDEGEYAYAGQLMLEGVPPYQLAYNMKLPGTYAAYALIMAMFGETSAGIRTGLLILNAATTLLLFTLARRLFGSGIGTVCAVTYAALSAGASVYGLAGHATHFVVAAAIAGILLLTYALDSDRLTLFFCSGTLLGLAYLMKQPGVAFSLFGLYYLAYRKGNCLLEWRYSLSRAGMFVAGVAWPFAITCLALYSAGVFAKFWFWTFDYARAYGTIVPYWAAWRNFHNTLAGLFWEDAGLWVIVICGVISQFLNQRIRSQRAFVIGLVIFSFSAVSAGFYFREHYFIMLLPVASLLCGISVVTATEALQQRKLSVVVIGIPGFLYAVAIVYFVFQQAPFFFAPNPETACERRYYNDPLLAARTGVFTSTIVSTAQKQTIALFFTGRQHAGENLADVLQRRAAELAPPLQMCDALSRNLPKLPEKLEVIVGHCLAHARRRFVEVTPNFPEPCRHVLEQLGEIYGNDAVAREQAMTPEERLRFHQRQSGPVMDQLQTVSIPVRVE